MDNHYDIILSGGGCAGLSLAYYLHKSEFRDARILILDTAPKTRNDKTWCYWSSKPAPFKCASEQYWEQIEFVDPDISKVSDIDPYRYYHIRSLDFYDEIYQLLEQNPNVEFRYETVNDLADLPNGAKVVTSRNTYTANWIFNSIVFPQQVQPEKYFYLKQHFCGWRIKLDEPGFDPLTMRMMDFSVDQGNDTRFVYILPFSEDEALIEYTVFSSDSWDESEYYSQLRNYISQQLKLEPSQYQILEEETGVIPMTNHPFPRKTGKHIYNLGTAGGFTKPSTGYTFSRIQEDTQALVRGLCEKGNPDYALPFIKRFAFYDSLLLYIIKNHGHKIRPIFHRLFSRNKFYKILRFLNEETTLWEELKILVRLPWAPFFNAIWRYTILGRTRKIEKKTFRPVVTVMYPEQN